MSLSLTTYPIYGDGAGSSPPPVSDGHALADSSWREEWRSQPAARASAKTSVNVDQGAGAMGAAATAGKMDGATRLPNIAPSGLTAEQRPLFEKRHRE